MPRRQTSNRTGIVRIDGISANNAWVGYCCVSCGRLNTEPIGQELLTPEQAIEESAWSCPCGFVHSASSPLPDWPNWPPQASVAGSEPAERFWTGFFRIYTEHPESYWKQCNTCGRVQPFAAFSKHVGWGPLERQMECRSCKGAINAVLNPLRTKEQLHEGSARRRLADLLLKGEDKPPTFAELFRRFNGRCFKTGRKLDIHQRGTWAMDHILPQTWLYPLTAQNACLLSKEANQAKKARWPAGFYKPDELIRLAQITGANLELLSSRKPVANPNIDVDACVTRFLKVRQGTDLGKRIVELKAMLTEYGLVKLLSAKNRRLLGF